MMYMPFMWVIILGTAILSAVVTQALPMVPKWWNALKNATKRRKTRKKSYLQKPHQLIQIELTNLDKKIKELEGKQTDIFDVMHCDVLAKRIDELEEQMDNVAKNSYRREQNRKSNIRRTVREYLEELKTSK